MTIPHNHHYVPRFILRNYSEDKKMINIYDIKKKEYGKKNLAYQFRRKDLYKDITNENIMYVEEKFGELENKSSIILQRFIDERQRVSINRVELNTLKKFFFLMEFRSEKRRNQYFYNMFDDSTRSILDKYTNKDGDYVSVWIRELKYMLDTDIDNYKINENLTPMIYYDFINKLKFTYIVVWDSCQGEEFILTDDYGTFEWDKNWVTPVISFYPLTPRRLIGFVNKARENKKLGHKLVASKFPSYVFNFPKNIYVTKGQYNDEDIFVYNILKIRNNEVKYANTLLLNEAKKKICINELDSVKASIKKYQNFEGYNKRDYTTLLYLD